MHNETQALIGLIESWQAENMELALQIVKGNPNLRQAIEEIYLPFLSLADAQPRLEMLLQYSNNKNFQFLPDCANPEPSDTFIELLERLPIEHVYCYKGNLQEIPWWIFHLKSLKIITLTHNKISSIPAEIAHLSQLRTLELENNIITDIHPNIGQLKELIVLKINNNKIKRLPESIVELKQLKKLQLDFNQIKELPPNIGELTNMEWLCLEHNKITSLPASLANHPNLQWLSIEGSPLGKKNRISYGMYISASSDFFLKLLK